jgi:hypothetical protein
MLSHSPYSPDLVRIAFLFIKLRMAMGRPRLEGFSSIQQTLMRQYEKKHFLRHSADCMSNVYVVPKQSGTILSDGINKHVCLFMFIMASVQELNCHTDVEEVGHITETRCNQHAL